MIWDIIDRLMKSAHFTPLKEMWSKDQLATAYRRYILRQHGVLRDIVSNRDAKLLSNF